MCVNVVGCVGSLQWIVLLGMKDEVASPLLSMDPWAAKMACCGRMMETQHITTTQLPCPMWVWPAPHNACGTSECTWTMFGVVGVYDPCEGQYNLHNVAIIQYRIGASIGGRLVGEQ